MVKLNKKNMISYMKRHEQYVKEMLDKNLNQEALKDPLEYHLSGFRYLKSLNR